MARDTKDIRIGEHRPLEIVLKEMMPKKDRNPSSYQDEISDEKRSVELCITDVSSRSDLAQVITVATMGILIVFLINLLSTIGRIPFAETSLAKQAKAGFQLLAAAQSDDDFSRVEEIFKKLSRAPFLNESYNGNFMLRKEETAKHLADAGRLLVRAKKHFVLVKKSFTEAIQELHKGFSEPLVHRPKVSPVLHTFHRFFDDIEGVTSDISQAYEEISNISEAMIPEKYRSFFTGARAIVSQAKSDLEKMLSNKDAVFTLLGDARPHRIMLVFQNNQEIRPTGGFIGSFLLLEMQKGYVTSLNFHDVYDFDNPFTTPVDPPDELKTLTNSWALRDSNFSPDFRISGEKMAWFLEQEGGPKVDTVFAINLRALGKLLELTGPIAPLSGELSAPITAENYDTVLTSFVESKFFGLTTPKYIVKYLIPELQKQIFRLALSDETREKLFETLFTLQSEKHFLAYSRKDEIENLFASLNIAGDVRQPKESEDYLQVVLTSIGGTKSDRYVTTDVTHQTFFDGETIKNRVRVTRKHGWSKKEIAHYRRLLEPFGVTEIPSYLIDIMGRGKNTVNVRLYVPEGSFAISDVAQKYDSDLKKTYFSFPITVEPGETATAEVEYVLPFKAKTSPFFTYRLTVEPQAGMWNPVKITKLMQTDRVIQSFPDESLEIWLKDAVSFAALIE